MMDSITYQILRILILAPPILLALTVHEVSHGLVAWLRGDSTAKEAGRLTLNPLRHLDPVGTLVFFVTAWMGAGFGWAKPVPVNAARMHNPRKDMIWVSAAGPAANLLMAGLVALCLHALIAGGFFAVSSLGYGEYPVWKYTLGQMIITAIQINVVLAFFNLLPLPPLDGSGILAGLLPLNLSLRYQEMSRWGIVVLMALIFLPGWLPGFPDIIDLVVITPAMALVNALV